MALKAYKEQTFKADIKFEDGSVKEVEFRLPRNTDIYRSEDGNTNLNTLYTFANMAKPFKKPVQVELDDGSIINVDNIKALMDLGITIDLSDAIIKWFNKKEEVEKDKEKLVKKSK